MLFTVQYNTKPAAKPANTKVKTKGSRAKIYGGNVLNGAELIATDLRASVCLVLAGLVASNKTILNRIYHLDRGYEKIVEKTAPVSSTKVAEMTKILENIHRAVNIGLVNELKMVSDKIILDAIHEQTTFKAFRVKKKKKEKKKTWLQRLFY